MVKDVDHVGNVCGIFSFLLFLSYPFLVSLPLPFPFPFFLFSLSFPFPFTFTFPSHFLFLFFSFLSSSFLFWEELTRLWRPFAKVAEGVEVRDVLFRGYCPPPTCFFASTLLLLLLQFVLACHCRSDPDLR